MKIAPIGMEKGLGKSFFFFLKTGGIDITVTKNVLLEPCVLETNIK